MKTKHIPYLISNIKELITIYLTIELNQEGLHNLVPSHGAILYYLFENNHITMKEIAQKINRDKSTITALTNKLIHLGYVHKIENPNDKRSFLLSLTSKGRSIEPRYRKISENLQKKVLSPLNEHEKETLLTLLLKIKNNFSEDHEL